MHSNNSNSTLSSSCWKMILIYARCMIYLSCFKIPWSQGLSFLQPSKKLNMFYYDYAIELQTECVLVQTGANDL